MMAAGPQVEDLADGRLDACSGSTVAGAERLDQDRHGLGDADGVRDLDLAAAWRRPTATTFLATQRAA